MQHAFSAVERLYVADGHHRCKASSRAAGELRGTARVYRLRAAAGAGG
jgi:uncharacterized protein (DUF1015 family)